MRSPSWRCAVVVLATLAATTPLAVSPPAGQIRGVDGLARAYDFILEARFDQVDAELRRACGPAPPEACDVLGATSLLWQILLDPESRELDDEFSTAVDQASARTEVWTERDVAISPCPAHVKAPSGVLRMRTSQTPSGVKQSMKSASGP